MVTNMSKDTVARRLAELRQRQADTGPKKLTNISDMERALKGAGEEDSVLVWRPGTPQPWRGLVVKKVDRDEFLVKGKGGMFKLLVGSHEVYLYPATVKFPTTNHLVAALAIDHMYQPDAGYDQRTGEFGRGGILVFDVVMEDYNIEEDRRSMEDGDEDATERLQSVGLDGDDWDKKALLLEGQFVAELKSLFGVSSIGNEGHGNDGALTCKISVKDWAEVKRISDAVSRNHTGGDDEITLNTPYMAARGFTLYPDEDMFNGRAWGTGYGRLQGDLDEWLADFKPGGAPGAKRASNTLYQKLQRVAAMHPETRAHLVPILRKYAAEGGGAPRLAKVASSVITPEVYTKLKPGMRVRLGIKGTMLSGSGTTEFQVGATTYSKKYGVYSKRLFLMVQGEPKKVGAPWTLYLRSTGNASLAHGDMAVSITSFEVVG